MQPATLQVIADSVCIPKLSADAAKVLAPDVEYRLREIIQVRWNPHGQDLIRTVHVYQIAP